MIYNLFTLSRHPRRDGVVPRIQQSHHEAKLPIADRCGATASGQLVLHSGLRH